MHRSLRIGTGALDASSLAVLRSGPYEGKIAGLYDLEETLGRGHFAVVKLARHVFTGEKVAVKVIDKSKLDEVSKAHLFQEVRCMKLVQHPNVVRLYEVIDTATKLYLILELGDGGDLYDYIMRHDTGLSEQLAKEYFRQIVRAISYCHQLHVVHRDLKPENVVFFEKLGVVKLTDFGFSNKFCPGQKLETSCGSLAYSAPEILLGDSYDAPAVDVWSLGVILYMLVCGQAPFQEANDSETLIMIMDCKYNVPSHVSKDCRELIARMLVRNPEKRATLAEIANHQWLSIGKQDNPPLDMLPLVSREQLSEEDHNLIVQKIVNGNIATKEEIQECLDKNEYNHITATYYLLAERKLRSKRQDQVNKNKRPEHLAVPHNSPAPKRENNGALLPVPCLLTVPRTPGDVPQRTRKCSIVQEDEEEEDISSCSGREELVPPLNRRGSRSEGRLNLALQERIAESERRRPLVAVDKFAAPPEGTAIAKVLPLRSTKDDRPEKFVRYGQNLKWRLGKSSSLVEPDPIKVKAPDPLASKTDLDLITTTTTTIITDSSTISIPIITTNPPSVAAAAAAAAVPKYKTMPSPIRTTVATAAAAPSPLQLNEIFEEGEAQGGGGGAASPRFVSRNQNRTTYEQRRSKFHKARTASCSSSDASDDDSEKRKKRAHKLNNATSSKPYQGRRDSHDDSSDSQEPGGGNSAGTNGRIGNSVTAVNSENNTTTTKNGGGTTNNTNNGGGGGGSRKNTTTTTNGNAGNPQQGNLVLVGRRHKAGRRRTGETRLRESQSLNRITEVQEDVGGGGGGSGGTAHALVVATSVVGTQVGVPTAQAKAKGIGARILQSMSGGSSKRNNNPPSIVSVSDVDASDKSAQAQHVSRKDTVKSPGGDDDDDDEAADGDDDDVENKKPREICSRVVATVPDKSGLRRMKLLGKYFQVHKKLCIPLPGLFTRNRLYKAQSCSSLVRDKITMNPETMLRCRQRAVSVIRNSDGDINQNDNNKQQQQRKSSTVVQLNNVCNELTGICAVHLGQASKCCSFC